MKIPTLTRAAEFSAHKGISVHATGEISLSSLKMSRKWLKKQKCQKLWELLKKVNKIFELTKVNKMFFQDRQ